MDGQPITYREHPPSARLAGFVRCYWTSSGWIESGGAVPNRVLPDGCMDIIFDLGDPPRREGGAHHGLAAFAVGAMRTASLFLMAGRVRFIGVRFRPGGATPFLRVPAGELTDRAAALGGFWGSRSDEIVERLAACAGEAARVALLDRILSRRLQDGAERHPTVRGTALMIARSQGRASVRSLAAAAGVGTRQLQRVFQREVGLSPKTACRVARFQSALATLRREPGLGWSRLAYRCGYHDQAHLVREFRDLAGITPAAWRAERAHVASIQYTEPVAR